MPKSDINSAAIRTLADLLDETGLSEIEYDTNGLRIRVARVSAPAATVAAPAPAAPTPAPSALPEPAAAPGAADASHPGAVTSPMVGTVYLAPEPEAPNFVAPGDAVIAGQTLMLVEAMKTFNEIKATKAGTVKQVLVENAQPVEYGDVLMVIE